MQISVWILGDTMTRPPSCLSTTSTPYPFHRSISHDNAENRHWTWFRAKSTAVATPVILTPRCKKKKWSPKIHLSIEVSLLRAKLSKVWRKNKFDTYPDPYPKRLSPRLSKCNSKNTTLPALRIKLSITLIKAKVSELQIQKFCIW